MRSYANVTAVERVFSILEFMNRSAYMTVQRISEECGIPAPSVVRTLETLIELGYVEHISRRGGYRLTARVRKLSAGYHGVSVIIDALKQYADALTARHIWPFSIATQNFDAMVVQYSTIPSSPLAHKTTTLHQRLSLVARAHGRAYLAFCSDIERRHLMRLIVSSSDPEKHVIPDARAWRRMISATREQGFGSRDSSIDSSTQSIAVPVFTRPGRVVATIGMTFFPRAVREEQIAQYARSLREAASEAGAALYATGQADSCTNEATKARVTTPEHFEMTNAAVEQRYETFSIKGRMRRLPRSGL